MLYKILNETSIQQFSGYIEVDGLVYTNQLAEEKALESGEWFPLVAEDMPEYDTETQYLTKQYTQEGNQIRLSWAVHDNPVLETEEDDTADYVNAAKILLGEIENDEN
jgi:hypothetical protein